MSNEIQNLLIPLAKGVDLSPDEAARAFQIIMNGGATPAQMGAFLMGLRQKGETVDELVAGATVLRAKATEFHAPADAIDTCGTGGDAKGTLNISTATAIVVAACGLPVAKHGNKAVTSACGSSDVLAALGVNLNAGIFLLEKALKECRLAFLIAPRFHTAMRHVAPVRQELGLRTIFNLLGPLANPAKTHRQILGVFAREWMQPMAEALHRLGCRKAWVVHGSDGMDELTLTGPSYVTELSENGTIEQFTLNPEDFDLKCVTAEALKGGDAAHNAREIAALLAGKPGPFADAVALNAAAALVVGGKALGVREGIEAARNAIAQGTARETLAQLIHITRADAVAP